MKIDQISVFLENRAGQLAEVISTLAEAGINIRGLSLADTSDFGILRLIVCEEKRASQLLLEKGFTIGRTSVLACAIEDRVGGLNQILQLVSRRNINLEYMYGCACDKPHTAVMVFRFDKIDETATLLQETGIRLLSTEMLCM